MISRTIDTALSATMRDLAQECGIAHRPENPAQDTDSVSAMLETRLVEATWTLRRLPDREAGFLYSRGVLWPAMDIPADTEEEDTKKAKDILTGLIECRKRTGLSPKAIDRMQPMLDCLRLIPDLEDRRIVFWGCWHQDGAVQNRIPWAKVRRSLGQDMSRWTLKRRYQGGIDWLARILQQHGVPSV